MNQTDFILIEVITLPTQGLPRISLVTIQIDCKTLKFTSSDAAQKYADKHYVDKNVAIVAI